VGFAVPATLMGHLEVTAVTNPVTYYPPEKMFYSTGPIGRQSHRIFIFSMEML